MSEKWQSALHVYKARREGTSPEFQAGLDKHNRESIAGWKILRMAALMILLGIVTWFALPGPPDPVNLTYEIDLAEAEIGDLVITIIAEGNLPGKLDLQFPPGVFTDHQNGVYAHTPTASALDDQGLPLKPLAIEKTLNGWKVSTGGTKRAGFIYHVGLNRVKGQELDVRRHISSPIRGGVRMAGFEIFVQPVGLPVDDITVAMHNPDDLPLLVPWPALVTGSDLMAERSRKLAARRAHLGQGQGFVPEGETGPREVTDRSPHTTQVPDNVFYSPRDLADLNNSLLICGDLVTSTSQARNTVIQLATDTEWSFTHQAAMDLVRRIARTEIGFFGSAPSPQITVILAVNEITGREKFDVYGVHTGSSILVMLEPGTTWGMLEEHASSVIAHEMFHGWLGEAIPQSDPQMLWFTEGATTWYAARMLTAAGIWDPDYARAVLDARLEKDYTLSPVKTQMSIADAAAKLMAKPVQIRFAYAGGVKACMGLDQMLAEATGRERPLDEVLRYLYDNRDGTPLTRQSFVAAVQAVTGVDCNQWLNDNVYKKTTLPAVIRVI